LLPAILLGSMAIMFVSMFVGSILTLLGAIALPVALSHTVAEDDLVAAFRVRQWWGILKADKLGYFISWVIIAGLMGILYLILMLAYSTLVLCCLLPILMAPVGLYIMLIGAALFGQTYRESRALLAVQEQMEEVELSTEPADDL